MSVLNVPEDGVFTPKLVVWVIVQQNLELYDKVFYHFLKGHLQQ